MVSWRHCGVPRPKSGVVTPYPRVKSKAGLHIEVTGSHDGYGDFLKKCFDAGRPVNVKAFYDGGSLMQCLSVDKDSITIWRGRPLNEDEDNPSGDWQWDASETPAIAKSWMDRVVDRWKSDRGVTKYLEVTNEPNGATQKQFENQRDFFIECMKYADAGGFKVAIGGFSSGCPEPWQVDLLAPAFKYAAEHGHIVATHDGSVNDARPLFQQAFEDGTALRYRMFKQRMDLLGYPMPAVAITECYWPDGYRGKNPYSDMAWYLGELAKDDYLLFMAWFSLGSYSFGGGGDVNIVGQLDKFADVIVSMPPIVYNEPAQKVLPVPFVSQNGPGAALSPNDCGPAALVMVERFLFGVTRTVDDWWEATGAGLGPITIGQLQTAASKFGYTLKEDVGTLDALRAKVDAGIPVIPLVKAKYLSRESFLYGHFVVVTGYTSDGKIITHDPNQIGTEIGGPNVVQEDFENAWGRCHEDGNPDHIYIELSKSPGVSILAGLHLRPGGEIRGTDYQCLTLANLKAAKVTTEANPDCVDVLVERGILPQNVVVRLFAEMSDRRVLPNEYYDWMKLPISLFLAKGVNKFEIHNEPNLSQEGFGLSWSSPEVFAQWYSEVIHLIRENHPGVQVGFPGLSPQPDNETWLAACNNVIAASDFVCAHAYWEDPALMSDLAHGGNWKRYIRFSKPLYITECSNPSKTVAKEDKGKQYKAYLSTLTEPVKAVYFFVSSSPAFPYEAWVSEDGTISQIPYLLR